MRCRRWKHHKRLCEEAGQSRFASVLHRSWAVLTKQLLDSPRLRKQKLGRQVDKHHQLLRQEYNRTRLLSAVPRPRLDGSLKSGRALYQHKSSCDISHVSGEEAEFYVFEESLIPSNALYVGSIITALACGVAT